MLHSPPGLEKYNLFREPIRVLVQYCNPFCEPIRALLHSPPGLRLEEERVLEEAEDEDEDEVEGSATRLARFMSHVVEGSLFTCFLAERLERGRTRDCFDGEPVWVSVHLLLRTV